tara:strand:+ start:455 stop:637 length:183 start_codon:yes stop_codon:yes gene_type:complete
LSVRAEILYVNLRKMVLGLGEKNYNKDAQAVDFQFSSHKRAKIPLFRLLKMAITKKTLVR